LGRGDTSKNVSISKKVVTFLKRSAYGKSIDIFSDLRDSCVERIREHNLEDILFITIASVLCRVKSWNEMKEFGRVKEKTELHLRIYIYQ
jgi:hypothetical protein